MKGKSNRFTQQSVFNIHRQCQEESAGSSIADREDEEILYIQDLK